MQLLSCIAHLRRKLDTLAKIISYHSFELRGLDLLSRAKSERHRKYSNSSLLSANDSWRKISSLKSLKSLAKSENNQRFMLNRKKVGQKQITWKWSYNIFCAIIEIYSEKKFLTSVVCSLDFLLFFIIFSDLS